jgi:hypothetical protein
VPSKQEPASEAAARIRDRIVSLERLPASELQDNARNWRLHPYGQRVALRESLEQVGIADALIAYRSERNEGKLTLIDGHLRHEDNDDLEWPVLVTDLNDAEADLMLATLDPMTAMATVDPENLGELIEDVHTGTPALEDLLRSLETPVLAAQEAADADALDGPREMELQAMEHYDYIVVLFRNALDWQQAKERLGIEHEGFTLRDGKMRRIGLGRVVDGKRLLELLG